MRYSRAAISIAVNSALRYRTRLGIRRSSKAIDNEDRTAPLFETVRCSTVCRSLHFARRTSARVVERDRQEIRTLTGMLMVTKGQEITHALLIKLDNFSRARTIRSASRIGGVILPFRLCDGPVSSRQKRSGLDRSFCLTMRRDLDYGGRFGR